MHRRILITASLLVLAACATSGATGSGHSRRGQRDVITAEEIAAKPELSNAYDAVQMLRPQFLTSRGQTSVYSTVNRTTPDATQPLPVVFIDDQRFGDVSSLRQIAITDVQEIRYISPSEATTRWGTGYPNGVIQVVRKTR